MSGSGYPPNKLCLVTKTQRNFSGPVGFCEIVFFVELLLSCTHHKECQLRDL